MADFKIVKGGVVYTLGDLGVTSVGLNGEAVTADLPDGLGEMRWAA